MGSSRHDPPAFAKAMERLKLHQISEPVYSDHGWHLIQVVERRTTNIAPQEFSEQAKEIIFRREYAKAVQTWMKKIGIKLI